MTKISISIDDDLVDQIDELHGNENDPFKHRSEAVEELATIGLEWRAAWSDTESPARAREQLENERRLSSALERHVGDLEEQLQQSNAVARELLDRDRSPLQRVMDWALDRDPYSDLPELEEPEQVEAEPVDRDLDR
jgi:Arc/MetJ-type ribon-helix-helix transcriptional regulator